MKISHSTYDINELIANIEEGNNGLPTSSLSANTTESLSDNILNGDDADAILDDDANDGCLETSNNDEVLITDMEGNPVVLRKYFKV